MKRRVAPEELEDNGGPLFADPVKSARDRGHRGARQAASRASKIDAGWRSEALAAVREHARRYPSFLSEHVRVHIPDGADRRALGHIVKEAERLGWIKADGFAPAASSNGSPKTAWKSLIYTGDHE